MTILVKLLENDVKIPTKGHSDDGGWDIYTPHTFSLAPQQGITIECKLAFLLPLGWTGLVRSRSSVFKNDITTEGTIDRYTGEIKIRLFNMGLSFHSFYKGSRIAQIVPALTGAGLLGKFLSREVATLASVYEVLLACESLEVVEELPKTSRGGGGHGSTGK